MDARIGFIGLGAMGQPMARNLLKAGYTLTVYNRTAQRAVPLALDGAAVAVSSAAVAAESDVIITMVSDSAAVEQVLLGEGGVIEQIKPGSVVIDMSTISPETTRKLAAALRERGCDLLDAPVSGGVAGAEGGTLAIMVGGSPATFTRCLPILEALGKKIMLMGEVGMGQTTKLCNQVIGMGTLLAVAEGLKLAQAAGADLGQIIDVVGAGAAGSWQLANTGKLIAAEDWRAGFRVALALKDVKLALAEAARLGLDLDGAETTAARFSALVDDGDGDLGVQRLGKRSD